MALCALAAGAAPATALVGDCTPGASWLAARANLEASVIALVNQHRASLGLSTLDVSPALTRSAEWKARHMATYRYFGHDDPSPPVARSAGERLAACGYAASWGENIAEGFPTAAATFAGWLASPEHKANMENPSWRVTGAGVAFARGGIPLWVQDFGTTADTGTTSPAPTGSKRARIVLRDLRLSPPRPRPGDRLVAKIRAVFAPTLKPVREATVTCHGTSGGQALAVVGQGLADGVAHCAWRIASTKLVQGTIVVTSDGRSATARFEALPR